MHWSKKFETVTCSGVSPKDLNLAHDEKYIDRFVNNHLSRSEMKLINLPWSTRLLNRSLLTPAGTFEAAKLALKTGVACHTAGGSHHAYRNFGYGFCVFNDLAYAALRLLKEKLARRVLILDCDVHQGDGTIDICKNNPDIFTCSIHGGQYIGPKRMFGSLDVVLPDGTEDAQYLSKLKDALNFISNNFLPDIVIYDAGVDVHLNDKLGRLNITSDGIIARDQLILAFFQKRDIPVATVIGGGYSINRTELINRHMLVFETLAQLY
jgi:acetoin utilization deacetylase AcuC-like enzyme